MDMLWNSANVQSDLVEHQQGVIKLMFQQRRFEKNVGPFILKDSN